MRVTNHHGAPVTAGGVTIAPGTTGDPDIEPDHPFVLCGWLRPGDQSAAPAASAPARTDAPPSILLVSDAFPSVIELSDAPGDSMRLVEVVQMAVEDFGLSVDEWNAQDTEDRLGAINGVIEDLRADRKSDTAPAAVEFTAKHKGGGKWIIVDPEGQEVPDVSGNKEEIQAKVAQLNAE